MFCTQILRWLWLGIVADFSVIDPNFNPILPTVFPMQSTPSLLEYIIYSYKDYYTGVLECFGATGDYTTATRTTGWRDVVCDKQENLDFATGTIGS